MLYPPNQPVYHHLGISNSFSTGVLRKIGFVLLIVALVAVAARKSWIEPQNGHISRPSRYGRDASVECPSDRPFVCDALDELGQEYPPWLKKDGGKQDFAKCASCNTAAREKCPDPDNFLIRPGERLKGNRCSPDFCKLGETTSADCIAPVKIDAINETVYLPFNLCTREMVASGQCDEKNWSKKSYSTAAISHTTKYFVQCDAGFVIPKMILDAVAKNPKLPLTCIPSLQMAAGYLQTDETSFDKNPYDVFDPLTPKYCPQGGRQAGQECDPLPVCAPDGTTKNIFAERSVVKPSIECDKQCEFPRLGGQYPPDDCVLLDISDPTGTPPYYSLRRALSGPYATLMSEEETINYLAKLRPKNDSQPSITTSPQPETPEGDGGSSTELKKLRWKRSDKRSRQKRQGTPLPSVIYPRCIKTDGLPEGQRAIVEADELLDCAKNPFYKQFGAMALTVSKLPPCSDVDQNQKFCVVTRQTATPTLPPTTVTPEEPEQLGLFLGIGAAVLIAGLLVVGVIYLLKSGGRKKAEDEPAVDPKSESSDNSQAATPNQAEPTGA